ncbi:MAG: hypothetical protein U5L08_07750 [Xanthomonadales bacterium]|nr:hypothetical protein [Xanthomonadales bacterium]
MQGSPMTDRQVKLERAFEALKRELKEANVEALDRDAFTTSRDLAGVMEQLSRLQIRARALYRGGTDPAEAATVPLPSQEGSFPRFFRSGRILYKEGLRQDGESVYVQKVNRDAFEAIFRSIADQKRKFKPAKLIKDTNQPSYQVYILLNVMQEQGLLENPERGTYRLTSKVRGRAFRFLALRRGAGNELSRESRVSRRFP